MLGIEKFLAICDVKRGYTLVCGSKNYPNKLDRRKIYEHALGVDMLEGDGVDLVHDLEQPLPDGMTFDHVDCVSTLEHVRRPWLFAQTVENALVDGGTFLFAAPWVWRIHGYPDDYFRYTPSGVASLFPSIKWERQKYIVEEKVMKIVPRLDANGTRWFARSDLAMFGRKCCSTS